jgi:hypothetical protein
MRSPLGLILALITAGPIVPAGCASRQGPAEAVYAEWKRDWEEHYAYQIYLESKFTCYYEHTGGTLPSKIRGDEPLTRDELSLMAVVYRKLVFGSVFWNAYNSCQPVPPEMMVSVSSWYAKDTPPPQAFLDAVSTSLVRAVSPGPRKWDVPSCELNLLTWISPDSAYVSALVLRPGSGHTRSALAVRNGDDWIVCPSRGVGVLCGMK